jgi:DNA processing protein
MARAFAERRAELASVTPGAMPPVLRSLARAAGVPEAEAADAAAAALLRADAFVADAAARGLTLRSLHHPDYPTWLAEIVDPPPVLWVRGQAGALDEPAVAVVGARDATPSGLAVSRRLALGLAEAGLTVVSGLAVGIDGAAHAGALDAGGRTVAVLGCGVDVIYPRSHEALAVSVAASGALVSELPPGTPPLAGHFPLRNRIISGLARAVVVVEAHERSGSLITARLALEQGRDVLAVPGGVASGRHRGCHALIKDGARLVETVEDILDELGWSATTGFGPIPADKPPFVSDLESVMAAGEPYALDDLAERTGRATSALLADLGRLEVAGRVARVGAGRFVRLDGSAMDRGRQETG